MEWLDSLAEVRLLAGGVPCQPFSQAGNHGGQADPRNLFPEFLNAVRCLRPMAIVIENVSGLSKDTHSRYFEYVRMQLEFPFLAPIPGESWMDHSSRIENHRSASSYVPAYDVKWKVINAADFGIPQRRRRVFVVAVRTSLKAYEFPAKSHSRAALLRDQATGEYWQRHGIVPRIRPRIPHEEESTATLEPWVTIRDVFARLGPPARDEKESERNHWIIPGARSYPGHTGSDLDMPSKVIKAGTHGVSGGENTLIGDDGCLRYFTLREMAIIQGFEDEHLFIGARSSIIRQIGNAVPPNLAKKIFTPLAEIVGVSG